MKALLIEPPSLWKYGNQRSKGAFGNLKTDIRWPPIDLLVIAGHLRKNGHSVSLIDAGGERLTLEQLQQRLPKEPPQIIIVNTSTTTIFKDLVTVRHLKEIYKNNTRVGVIGVHVMALPEETLSLCPELDFVVFSEPEIPILNLLNNPDQPYVKGIFYRQSGRIIKNAAENPIQDMDELGIPAHDLAPVRIYQEPQLKRKPMTITMVSRGCINNCIFCSSYFYGKYRLRSVNNVMDELRWITRDLGIKELKFYDDGITYNRTWAKSLFRRMLEEKIDLTWNTNIRADSIDEELLGLMRRTGCHTVNLGLESSDPVLLKNIRKNIDMDLVRRNVGLIKKAGIEVCAYFVYGLPGETRQTMQATLEFAKSLDISLVTFNIVTPHPGTDFYYYLEKNGYLKTKDWSRYDTNSPAVYDYPGLSGDEIYRSALDAYRSFYMRGSYFLKRLKRIDSWTELQNTIANFLAFFRNFIVTGMLLKLKGKKRASL